MTEPNALAALTRGWWAAGNGTVKPPGPRPPPGEPRAPWVPMGGMGGPMMMGDAPMMGMAPMGMMGGPMGGPMMGPMGMMGTPLGVMGAPMGMMGGPMMGPMAGMRPGMMLGDGFGAPMVRGGGSRGMMDLGPRPPPGPPPGPLLRRGAPFDEPDFYGGPLGPYGQEGFPRGGFGGGRRGDFERGWRLDNGWDRSEDFESDVLPGRRRFQYRSRGRCGWQAG